VYLPFVADRDKIRGMNEESQMSSKDRLDYERALREMSMKVDPQQGSASAAVVPAHPPLSNSMWKRMNQAAASASSGAGASSDEQRNKRP
jgi:hypothetical protein